MRAIVMAIALSLSSACVYSQALSPKQRVIYIGVGTPCPFPQERISEGVAAAKKDILAGRIVKHRNFGSAPVPPSNAELRRSKVESEVWKSFGVIAEFKMASDVIECWHKPFEQGYDQEVDRFLQAKLGSNYVMNVEQITDKKTTRPK